MLLIFFLIFALAMPLSKWLSMDNSFVIFTCLIASFQENANNEFISNNELLWDFRHLEVDGNRKLICKEPNTIVYGAIPMHIIMHNL